MRELPVAGWAPRTTNDTGVATEVVREEVGGEIRDCLRITWTKPTRDKQRYAVVKVPFPVDAREWNTLSSGTKGHVSIAPSEAHERRIVSKVNDR